VGLDAARKITAALSHGQVLISLGPNVAAMRLSAAIRAQLEVGNSETDTARALGCHERTLRRERARMRKEPGRC
jgi:hypothetical protein